MRNVLRYSSTALLLLLAGLWVFTGETVADELGYSQAVRDFLRGGVAAVTEWGAGTWIGVGFVFFLGATIALWADYFVRRETTVTIPREKKIRERISGKYFANQEVPLDGKAYDKCEFQNVTFVYNGGKSELTNSTIRGCMVKSGVKQLDAYAHMLFQMGMVSVPVTTDDGLVENKNTFGATKAAKAGS